MLKIGLLTKNPSSWCSGQIRKSIEKKGAIPISFSFNDIVVKIGRNPPVSLRNKTDHITDLKAVIVRPIGRGSLDEIIFRLDILHRIERMGVVVINPPSAIEKSIDKYYALSLMNEKGIPVPQTIATEDHELALEGFKELDSNIVIKPLFGSQGKGITAISDPEIARRAFQTLSHHHHVLYIQKFIQHGNRDIRSFVIGNRIVASMYRNSSSWKTNISQGGKPSYFQAPEELEKLTIKAVDVLGCKIAGIDILEGPEGYLISEINSQPGFRGLQSVSKINIADSIIEYIISDVQ
jgi:ribosomal protein S6--L-glutamate ligase/tetrahydromethanopterin:alpha-L-glutamate ligase